MSDCTALPLLIDLHCTGFVHVKSEHFSYGSCGYLITHGEVESLISFKRVQGAQSTKPIVIKASKQLTIETPGINSWTHSKAIFTYITFMLSISGKTDAAIHVQTFKASL